MAGIDTTRAPGYQEIVIRPRPAGPITHARGEYDSVYGKIVSDWTAAAGGSLKLRVTIPPNTHARVYLPVKPGGKITESGKAFETKEGPDGTRIASLGSGKLRIEAPE